MLNKNLNESYPEIIGNETQRKPNANYPNIALADYQPQPQYQPQYLKAPQAQYAELQYQQQGQYQQQYRQQNVQQPRFVDSGRVIIINNQNSNDVNACYMCGFRGAPIIEQRVGCYQFSWCCCLGIFTGFIGAWIPFCINDCYDRVFLCSSCLTIKQVIRGSC